MKTMIKTILFVMLCMHLPLLQLQAMVAHKQIPNKQHHICEWISKSNGRYCGKKYDTATTLQKHVLETHMIRIHVPSDKSKNNCSEYVCKWKNCKRKQTPFYKKSLFERHMRSHTGEKPFLCEWCGMSFTQKINLHQHILTHTGKKPFSCYLCDKAFTRKDFLQQHLREHTGKKPFSCYLCNKAFTRKDSLLQHYKSSEHKINEENEVIEETQSPMVEENNEILDENFLDEIDNVPLMGEIELAEIFKNYEELFENNHENND